MGSVHVVTIGRLTDGMLDLYPIVQCTEVHACDYYQNVPLDNGSAFIYLSALKCT